MRYRLFEILQTPLKRVGGGFRDFAKSRFHSLEFQALENTALIYGLTNRLRGAEDVVKLVQRFNFQTPALFKLDNKLAKRAQALST